MVSFMTSEGPLDVPDPLVRAVARHAQRQADLTAVALDAMGLFKSEPSRLPAGYLLELGAVLELGLWERQGLRPHLDVDLPTFREAADYLAARAAKGPAEFQDPDATPLCRRVREVWVEQFAWEGPELLEAEVLVSDVDDDAFVDVLAEFVWTHRQELSNLLRDGGNEP